MFELHSSCVFSLLISFRQYLCVSAEFCTESVPMQTNEGEVSEESSSKVSELNSKGQWMSRVGVRFWGNLEL